jgi:para-nitrobenzyl esterase
LGTNYLAAKEFPMVRFLFPLFCLTALQAVSQCDGSRYRQFVFSGFEKTAGVVYGSNVTFESAPQELAMDIYEPAGDTETARPLFIIAHGGFFLGGSRDNADVVPICEDLARMGYVTASITYRLGFPFSDLEASMTEAVMRGVQDMKAAIRWFRRSVEENGNPYGIDPEQICIGGVSAGGYIAMHLAYLDEEEELPEYVNLANPGLTGGLEGNSGNPGYPSHVNAVVNIAGALGDVSWIQPGDEPAALFHGDEDTTVPYGTDLQLILGVVPITEVDGSATVSERLAELEIPHCFETHEGYNHVPHVDNAAIYDTTLSILSNFLSHFACGSALDCDYRDIPAGIEELAQSVTFEAMPNPAGEVVYIRHPMPGAARVVLRDLRGGAVREYRIASGGSIHLGDLADGVYLLEMYGEGLREIQRLVVAR